MSVGNPSGAAAARVKDGGNARVSAQKVNPAAFVDSALTANKKKKNSKKKKVFGGAMWFPVGKSVGRLRRNHRKAKRRRQRFCRVDEETAGAETRDAAVMTLCCR